MSGFKFGHTKEYLKGINETARETRRYYATLIGTIAEHLKSRTEPASAIILRDEYTAGNFNSFDENGNPQYPMHMSIVVVSYYGYWTRKNCIGTVKIDEEFELLLFSEGWKKVINKDSDIQYELSLE